MVGLSRGRTAYSRELQCLGEATREPGVCWFTPLIHFGKMQLIQQPGLQRQHREKVPSSGQDGE